MIHGYTLFLSNLTYINKYVYFISVFDVDSMFVIEQLFSILIFQIILTTIKNFFKVYLYRLRNFKHNIIIVYF